MICWHQSKRRCLSHLKDHLKYFNCLLIVVHYDVANCMFFFQIIQFNELTTHQCIVTLFTKTDCNIGKSYSVGSNYSECIIFHSVHDQHSFLFVTMVEVFKKGSTTMRALYYIIYISYDICLNHNWWFHKAIPN